MVEYTSKYAGTAGYQLLKDGEPHTKYGAFSTLRDVNRVIAKLTQEEIEYRKDKANKLKGKPKVSKTSPPEEGTSGESPGSGISSLED